MKEFGKRHVLPCFFRNCRPGNRRNAFTTQMLLTMKLTIFLLTVTLLQTHAAVFSQNITLSGTNLPLKKVFREIERQTGYAVFYNNDLLINAKPVTLNVKDAPLDEVLKVCFYDQPLGYDIQNRTVFVTKKRFAALTPMAGDSTKPIAVNGLIKNKSGDPLSGVTVQVKGSRQGTVSDSSGSFTLRVPAAAKQPILVFSLVGYATTQEKAGTGSLAITMAQDIMKLDEVVVTGTSVRTEKKQLGNQITSVSSKDIANSGTPNVIGALSGKVPGAQVVQNSGDPYGGFSVKLRGIGSINGSSEPLYLIDGVIADNSSQSVVLLNADKEGKPMSPSINRLADINPNDIDHIEIINGAAAAAIYGSRAANGVVQIFTKRGAAGKPTVSFSTSLSYSKLRKKLPMNLYPFRFGVPKDSVNYQAFEDGLTMITNRYANHTAPNGLVGQGINGLWTVLYPIKRYDPQDDIFHDAIGTDNFISVSGGTPTTKYYMSGSFTNNDGILKNSSYQRYGGKIRLDQSFGSRLKVSMGLDYSSAASHEIPQGNNYFSPLNAMYISENIYDVTARDANGNLKGVEYNRVNPMSIIDDFKIRQQVNRTVADIQDNLKITDDISLDYVAGSDYYTQIGNQYQPQLPYAYDASGSLRVAGAAYPLGYASLGKFTNLMMNNDLNLSIRKRISDDFTSTTALGGTWQYMKKQFSFAQGERVLPFVTTAASFQTDETTAAQKENISEISIFGYYLQQTFGLWNKLYATGAVRFDGSSAFGSSHQNIAYPKASLSYLLSNENFWKNGGVNKWFSLLKLRGSWGQAGNLTGIGAYDRFTNYAPVVYTGYGVGGFIPPTQQGQSDIKPEKKEELEFGTDMSFLGGKIGLQTTVYQQHISDLILQLNQSPSTGYLTTLANVGKMSNKGIEILLTAKPVETKNFSWSTSVLFNKNSNKVTELYSGAASFIGFNSLNTTGVKVGKPVGVFNYTYFARNGNGQLLLDPNGLPQLEKGIVQTQANGKTVNSPQRDASGQPIGSTLYNNDRSPNPSWTGSFINEFSYRKFSFRFQLDALRGATIFNWQFGTRQNTGQGLEAEKELKGQLPRGYIAKVNGQLGPSRIQEYLLDNGNYIKLREIAVTYSAGNWGVLKDCSVALSARNLYSWDKYKGYDPETNSGGSSIVRGDDFGQTPIPRSLQLSFHTSF